MYSVDLLIFQEERNLKNLVLADLVVVGCIGRRSTTVVGRRSTTVVGRHPTSNFVCPSFLLFKSFLIFSDVLSTAACH